MTFGGAVASTIEWAVFLLFVVGLSWPVWGTAIFLVNDNSQFCMTSVLDVTPFFPAFIVGMGGLFEVVNSHIIVWMVLCYVSSALCFQSLISRTCALDPLELWLFPSIMFVLQMLLVINPRRLRKLNSEMGHLDTGMQLIKGGIVILLATASLLLIPLIRDDSYSNSILEHVPATSAVVLSVIAGAWFPGSHGVAGYSLVLLGCCFRCLVAVGAKSFWWFAALSLMGYSMMNLDSSPLTLLQAMKRIWIEWNLMKNLNGILLFTISLYIVGLAYGSKMQTWTIEPRTQHDANLYALNARAVVDIQCMASTPDTLWEVMPRIRIQSFLETYGTMLSKIGSTSKRTFGVVESGSAYSQIVILVTCCAILLASGHYRRTDHHTIWTPISFFAVATALIAVPIPEEIGLSYLNGTYSREWTYEVRMIIALCILGGIISMALLSARLHVGETGDTELHRRSSILKDPVSQPRNIGTKIIFSFIAFGAAMCSSFLVVLIPLADVRLNLRGSCSSAPVWINGTLDCDNQTVIDLEHNVLLSVVPEYEGIAEFVSQTPRACNTSLSKWENICETLKLAEITSVYMGGGDFSDEYMFADSSIIGIEFVLRTAAIFVLVADLMALLLFLWSIRMRYVEDWSLLIVACQGVVIAVSYPVFFLFWESVVSKMCRGHDRFPWTVTLQICSHAILAAILLAVKLHRYDKRGECLVDNPRDSECCVFESENEMRSQYVACTTADSEEEFLRMRGIREKSFEEYIKGRPFKYNRGQGVYLEPSC